MSPRHARGRDEGMTLVELLVTVAIAGVAFAIIVGAVWSHVNAAATHRTQADVQTVLRDYAEAVTTAPWVACATSYTPAAAAFTTPAGFTASNSVTGWNPATGAFDLPSGAGCTDTRLQRVRLVVGSVGATPMDYSTTLDIVKRDGAP